MSFIPYDNKIRNYLMGCINSKIYYYYLKTFINSTVNLQINDFRLFPVRVPNNEQIQILNAIINKILNAKEKNNMQIVLKNENELNLIIYDILTS